MKIDLHGHHAVVCGSSQGIGAGIATELARAGAKVTVVARNESRLKELLEELHGDHHEMIVADFTNTVDVVDLVKYIQSKTPDILVNNTGGPAPGPITEARVSDFEKALNMHLLTSHQLVQACLPGMKQAEYGRIINVISTSVKIPINGLGVSNTTRHAMAGWSKTLSNELAPFGITVNNILPGFIQTDRLSSLIEKLAQDNKVPHDDMSDQMRATVPAGRFGRPEEIGYLAAFLCSGFGAYINGVSVPVDGGKTGTI
ncbi:SDR family oxidoreductase [Marinoscillum sp. MHG1-6]|uniref:SDR family oxidoreductase n=1 Tax=Marinoscillum sp. MHG1-6 TaxID=2959627 RepID=UPI0021584B14|nr:SDR family oxidoreductase [Marinoscillum sp. MHG1-6]